MVIVSADIFEEFAAKSILVLAAATANQRMLNSIAIRKLAYYLGSVKG